MFAEVSPIIGMPKLKGLGNKRAKQIGRVTLGHLGMAEEDNATIQFAY